MRRGFTLIEMSLVLTIIGFFIVAAINVTKSIQTGGGVTAAKTRMTTVEKALQVYVTQHACLPCPADGSLPSSAANAGRALAGASPYVNTNTVTFCSATCLTTPANGVVPWLDLGLSEDEAVDGWGNRFRYNVATTNNSLTCVTAGTLTETDGMRACSVGSFPRGNLILHDLANLATGNVVNIAYVLMSSGPDGAFGFAKVAGTSQPNVWGQSGSDNQADNADGALPFVFGPVNSTNSTSHFDDIVSFKNAATIIYNCGAGSCGNPP